MARLPVIGSDDGTWGTVLNDFLSQSLTSAGLIKAGVVTKTNLETAVQTSLGKADTALQTAPVTSVAMKTGEVVLAKADVGLGNVDNTSDASKPVSTATQTALDLKANVVDVGSKVILIDNVAALPAGTPANVIVIVKA